MTVLHKLIHRNVYVIYIESNNCFPVTLNSRTHLSLEIVVGKTGQQPTGSFDFFSFIFLFMPDTMSHNLEALHCECCLERNFCTEAKSTVLFQLPNHSDQTVMLQSWYCSDPLWL